MKEPLDRSILHEIVRVVKTLAEVPDRVAIRGREYLVMYLDDHKQRLQESLRRHDVDRLNMLFGQLASKVKYQMLREASRRMAAATGIATAVTSSSESKKVRSTATKKTSDSPTRQRPKAADTKEAPEAARKKAPKKAVRAVAGQGAKRENRAGRARSEQ